LGEFSSIQAIIPFMLQTLPSMFFLGSEPISKDKKIDG
jgi:hypothetical protein